MSESFVTPCSSPDGPAALALVVGSRGAIATALVETLQSRHPEMKVLRLGRHSLPRLDLLDPDSIAACAATVADEGLPLRLLIDASGFLHGDGFMPEKSLRELDPAHLAHAFALNAIGPSLLMKHFLPLLPRTGRSVFASVSARVGSIGDNRLGGWYSYRASKAALNQLIRTAAIELRRTAPEAICVALHPGTVDSPLSAPFAKRGLQVRPPAVAAEALLSVLDRLQPGDSGGFFDHLGEPVPW